MDNIKSIEVFVIEIKTWLMSYVIMERNSFPDYMVGNNFDPVLNNL